MSARPLSGADSAEGQGLFCCCRLNPKSTVPTTAQQEFKRMKLFFGTKDGFYEKSRFYGNIYVAAGSFVLYTHMMVPSM
jgi:hypothetical protein